MTIKTIKYPCRIQVFLVIVVLILMTSNSFLCAQIFYDFEALFHKQKEITIKTEGLGIEHLQDLKIDLDENLIFLDRRGYPASKAMVFLRFPSRFQG